MQRHFSSLRLKAVPRMAEVEREVVPQSLPEAARAFLLGLGVCFAAWQWDGNVAHMPGSDAGGEQAPQRSRPGNDVTALGTRSFFTPPWLSGTRCALEDGQQELLCRRRSGLARAWPALLSAQAQRRCSDGTRGLRRDPHGGMHQRRVKCNHS